MTERNRLMQLIKEADKIKTNILFDAKKSLSLNEWCSIYADHLLANGVIVPPCNIGDTVYFRCCESIDYGTVKNMVYDYEKKRFVIMGFTPDETIFEVTDIFLTREDAERALFESKKNRC